MIVIIYYNHHHYYYHSIIDRNNIDNDSNNDGDHMWSYNSDNASNTNKINHNDNALWGSDSPGLRE